MTTSSVTLKAFIIGPIGDRDSPDGSPSRVAFEEGVQILEEVIVPACSAFGVQAIRADDIDRTGEIPEQVFRHLRDSPIVIADLTGANPNVMYELGLRHTTGKLTIQIGERDRLPFDVSAIRTIMFKRTPAGLVEARRRLSQVLAAGLDAGGDPVSATRVWFEAPGAVATLPVELDTPEFDAEEPGFLEKLADSEASFQSLVQAMATASSINEDITRVITEGTEKIKELEAKGGNSAAKLALVNRIAALLEAPASRLQVTAGEYGQSVERLEPGLTYLLEQLVSDPTQLAHHADFPGQLRNLIVAAKGSVDGALEFKSIVEQTGSATRSMKRVATRLALSLQAIASASSRIVALKLLTDQLPQYGSVVEATADEAKAL